MEVSPDNRRTIGSFDALSEEAMAAWDPEGDAGRRLLLNPAILRLLGEASGTRILDAGCGQGYLCRLLAARGAEVTGVDPARRLLDYAEGLEARRPLGIRYHQRDLSRLGQIGQPFDSVIANMVFLDIADWRAALASCVGALRRGGLLVISLLHPTWGPGASESWSTRGAVELREYLNDYEIAGGVGGGVNYHRPLSAYINEVIALGCALTELVEPALAADEVEEPDQQVLVHIPNYVVVAARRQ
ncbi:MAG TPA: class I SAM-dependent methyltransferase [Acidimicrobiales bacterium]|nr:class I SAM-dependent methyltransferase [Acidimicrobiales bacterium]